MSAEWLKIAHIISIIAWMAGLLYLPRLFVYHADCPPGSDRANMLIIMERRLLKAIMTPAMLASWVFGLSLAASIGAFGQPWLHVKLLLVIVLSAIHMWLARIRKQLETGARPHSAKFYRWLNEAPTVLMIGIIILVILKPW